MNKPSSLEYFEEISIDQKIKNLALSLLNIWELEERSKSRLEIVLKNLLLRDDFDKQIFFLNLSNFRVFCENYDIEFSRGDENIMFEFLDFLFYISKFDSRNVWEIFCQRNINYSYETLKIMSSFIISNFLTFSTKNNFSHKPIEFDWFDLPSVLYAFFFLFDENFWMNIIIKLENCLKNNPASLDLEINKIRTLGETKMSIVGFINQIFQSYCKKMWVDGYDIIFQKWKFFFYKKNISSTKNHLYLN